MDTHSYLCEVLHWVLYPNTHRNGTTTKQKNGRASSGAIELVQAEVSIAERNMVVRSAMGQLSTGTCLQMLCKFIHTSQGEFGVATMTNHPSTMLVLVVSVEPRKPGETGVTLGALVALVNSYTSNWPSGS